MKILLIYPGATWSPFDVARGYEGALRALGHEVFTFDYHKHYRFLHEYLAFLSERYGMMWPADYPTVFASERVAIELLDCAPDAILNVMGIGLHRRAYVHSYILRVPMALLLTESPYMDDHQAQIVEKGHVRLVLTNDRASVGAFEKLCDTVYLPHSFDPVRHYPHKVGDEYRTDLFFHGTLWPERKELFEGLDFPGWRVHISGTDFKTDDLNELAKHIIDNDEMALWYSGARIALNHHRTVRGDGQQLPPGLAYSLGPRAYEIAACGAFQLCDDARPELREVFGDTVATYRDRDDLRRQVEYYWQHEDERRDMAAAALERVQPCSFLARARDIVVPALERII